MGRDYVTDLQEDVSDSFGLFIFCLEKMPTACVKK